MKILGIESSSLVASVALLQDDTMIAEYTVNFKKTHSQTLLPMLDEIVSMTDTDLNEIDGIAVAEGPGSFTGLRIGSATAKGLGLALNKPILAVPTVDAMAYQLFGCGNRICPIMDAKRGQVYTGIYRFEREFVVEKEACAMDLGDLMDELMAEEGPVIFLGDGVPVNRSRIESVMGDQAIFASAACSRQRAAAVASLGARYLQEGKTQTAAEHGPNYHRVSQAERELAEKRRREREA